MKTIVENVALYRQSNTSVKLPWLLVLLGLCLVALCMVGCTTKENTAEPTKGAPPPITNVPLRIWFVADATDKAVIERQWLAGDERLWK